MRSSVRVVLVVVAVLAASALAWRGLFVTDSAADLIVTSATGATVRAAGAAITRPVRAGHIVRSRDQLSVEEGGRAVLEMGDATRLELAERSSIRVL
ncbi:MAG: hypothetical protein VX265_12510, partial [Myxococcota bacterium]|nr:hypothetical protein [Myxococcota bacterium]